MVASRAGSTLRRAMDPRALGVGSSGLVNPPHRSDDALGKVDVWEGLCMAEAKGGR